MGRSFGEADLLLLLQSAQWTVLIAAVAFVGGLPGGLLVSLARTAVHPIPRTLAKWMIDLFQGTPLLMQLFLAYFGSAIIGVSVSAWTAVAVAFTCHASAFLGEIWRGAIEAVPQGQTEAARALSLPYWVTMTRIVLPQALRIALAPTVGFLVQLIKSTSLASLVGFTELARTGQLITNVTYQPFLVYGAAGAIYFALCWPLSIYGGVLEQRFAMQTR